MNYATLVQSLQDTTQNSDPIFISYIPQFVQVAESKIYRSSKIPGTRKTATITMTQGYRSLTLPNDYINLKALDIVASGSVVNLIFKDPGFLDEMYPVTATQAQPKFYSHHDETTIRVAPTPDQNYT